MIIVWLSLSPKCEFPSSVIRPLPDALLRDVVSSKPSKVYASSFQLVHHIALNGICVHRGQVTALLLAALLSIIPAFRVTAVEEAVVTMNIPALIASAWCGCSCWRQSCCGVTIARGCTLSVAALLPRGAVRVGLAVGALAVRARVALCVSRAVVCRARLLAVVATDVHVVVTDGANRNGVSAVC